MPGNIDLSQMQDPLGLLRLGYAKPLLKLQATRWRDGQPSDSAETIAEETPVAIVYNGIPHVVMMATPQDLEDFVLGFSITEELIRSPADLEGLEVVRYSQGTATDGFTITGMAYSNKWNSTDQIPQRAIGAESLL